MTKVDVTRVDVAVIGSGHNALVAAAYLARAGLSVHVVERDSVIGGAVSTVERFPGHQIDRGSSAHIMIRHTGIIEELELSRFGLTYVDCDPWAFAPAPAGSGEPPIVFHRDLDATCQSIEAACGGADAQAYRRFVSVWGLRSERVMRAFSAAPTPGHLVRSFWGLGSRKTADELSRQFLSSGDALLDEYFTSERLKAALSWFGAQSGPPMSEPGTAPMAGFAALMHKLPPGRALGGSGALTKALAARIVSDGGTISTATPALSIKPTRSRWEVQTPGSTIHARRVLAGCHIHTTLDLIESGGFDQPTIDNWRRRIRVGPGIGMVVRLTTSALPTYPGVPQSLSSTGLQLLVDDRRQLHAAHGSAQAGELPTTPAVLGMSFTALDPSTAPPGEHQLTLWSQWHPYRLRDDRDWATVGDAEADRIIAEAERFAPGLREIITNRFVQTPATLAEEMNLVGGNVMHVEMSMANMFMWRPVPELARYRVPGASGLYLTGASTHPGGGVHGASGRSAARAILSDRRNPFRRMPFRRVR